VRSFLFAELLAGHKGCLDDAETTVSRSFSPP
jgi:hypothetical protein